MINVAKITTKTMKNLSKLNGMSSGMVYGIDNKFDEEITRNTDEIKRSIRHINSEYKTLTGGDPVEFISKLVYDSQKQQNGSSASKKPGIDKLMVETDPSVLSQLFAESSSKNSVYTDYDNLYRLIPQLKQCVEVIVNNIISPDDFTKNSLSVFYDNSSINDKEFIMLKSNMDTLATKYNTNVKLKHILTKACIYGEYHLGVLSAAKEFDNLLTEDSIYQTTKDLVNVNDIFNESELNIFSTVNNPKIIKDTTNFKDTLIKETKSILDDIIFDETSHIFLNEDLTMLSEDFNVNADAIQRFKDSDSNAKNNKKNNSKDLLFNANRSVVFDQSTEQALRESKGSFVKPLDPKKLVQIKAGDVVFGYYYIEADSLDLMNSPQAINQIFNTSQAITTMSDVPLTSSNASGSQYGNMDPKSKILLDVIMRNIGKKINKKYVANNAHFREIVYELLKADNYSRKRIKISFLSASEVIKFAVDIDENGNGNSKFKNILFTAKLYLSVLICNEMMKLSRSSDHRTFYIETGLSKDVEGTVQGIIRDMKSKEVRMNDIDSIESIFRVIGQFTDYFIPMVGGQKSIDIDTIPGMNVEFDNEWTEYLKKTMISGMGVPAAYLNYHEEIDFAKSLSMINGNFLRTIVVDQGPLGISFSKMMQVLYKNEYDNYVDESKNKKFKINDDNIDIYKISVKFPCPASLNLNNMAEQLGSATQIADQLVNVICGQNAGDNDKKIATYVIVKDLCPNLDLERYKALIEQAKIGGTKDTLKDSLTGDSEDDGMGGGSSTDSSSPNGSSSMNNDSGDFNF